MVTLNKTQTLGKSWWSGWFTPRTTDQNLLFREKTLRVLLALLIVLDALALVSSLAFWGKQSAYPIAEAITGLLFILAAVSVHRGRITESGYLMVAGFLFFSTFLTAFSLTSLTFITNYILAVVVISLVLPRSTIIPSAIVSTILIAVMSFLGIDSSTAIKLVTNSFITLIALAVLLYLLRAEFDNRLLATEAARRETEQALSVAQTARNEAEQANLAKTRFLSTMSHELRTPLGAIIGYVGILQANMIKDKSEALPLSKTQKDYIGSIRSNAEQLLGLINGVLDLAKISSGRMQPTLATVKPSDPAFIAGTVNDLRSLAINKNIELDLQFDSNTPAEVHVDTTQIKQVIKNLVANAIKFTDVGKVSVQVSSVANNGTWQIVVSDTGVGIKPESLKHIFEPFYQADNSDTRNYEGTGLGLAIAKSFVDIHKGTIQVESTLGKGTQFTIHLPC
jgi:signal transduction histidine kinase